MRFTSGSLEVVEDDAWRTEFPGSRRRMVNVLTRPLRGRYGYTGGAR